MTKVITENEIKLCHIDGTPPSILYSINIDSQFTVKAFRGNSRVPIRYCIESFDWKLKKFSELDKILEKIKNYTIVGDEDISHISKKIQEIANNMDADAVGREHVKFLSNQILAIFRTPHGRRYDAYVVQTALELMPRSRNCYKALRDILPLPHKNTLRSYFDKLGSPDSESVCKEVISKVFAEFEDPISKYCFITADEITIKPSLQFQKNQIGCGRGPGSKKSSCYNG